MIRSRIARMIVLPAVAAACAAAAIRADEPKPEDVLKSHGLKRSGSTYVVASEADAQRKLNEARLASRQLNYALMEQDAVEQGAQGRKGLVQELTQERIALNEQMSAVDQALDAMGPQSANVAVAFQRNQLVNQHNQLVAAINIVSDRLNLLRDQAADPQLAQKMTAELARRRGAFLQAILDLRQIVDKTSAEYVGIARDETIKRALAALSSKSKSTAFKPGPSREFLANVKLLEKAEKSILTEVVELSRKGGVYEVDVTFNGKVTVPLVFDTGASFTTISAELASRIGLKPQASDRPVELHVADGGVIKAKLMTIPSMRVGKFTVDNVVCAVMPPGKAEIPLLLGQSFHRHFTYKFTPESGQLILSRVETMEPRAKSTRPRTKTTKAKRSSKAATGTNAPAATTDSDNPN
ncbi:MAG: TIGR02281 family clan AA aspartic protease [Isosphaerales bacterium]